MNIINSINFQSQDQIKLNIEVTFEIQLKFKMNFQIASSLLFAVIE